MCLVSRLSPVSAGLGRVLVGRLAEAAQPKVGDDGPIVAVQKDIVGLHVAVQHAHLIHKTYTSIERHRQRE